MSEEKHLLDNLHGRVDTLMVLCSAMIASSKDAGVIMALFLKDLENSHKPDSLAKSEHYFLGMKAVHDQFLHAVKQVHLDQSLQLQEKNRKR